MLAEELENREFENGKVSTPSRDQKKKRGRKNFNVGEVNSFQRVKDNHGVTSEGEHSEEAVKGVKKPRLVESSESQEEEGNIAEDKTDSNEEIAEEIVGNKDHTTGLNEEDNILRVLRDMHEEVPLEDPGPDIEGEIGEEGGAGPKTVSEQGGEGAAGETQ